MFTRRCRRWISVAAAAVAAAAVTLAPSAAQANALVGTDWSHADMTGYCGDVNGGNVAAAEEFLRDRGLYTDAIDGEWGSHANSATITFQANNGLSGDGCIGPKTWAKMQSKTVFTHSSLDTSCSYPNLTNSYYRVPSQTAASFVFVHGGYTSTEVQEWRFFVDWPSANGWTRYHLYAWQDSRDDWTGCA